MRNLLRAIFNLSISIWCIILTVSGGTNETAGCIEVYLLKNSTDTYKASCSVLTHPCSGYHAVPSDCQKFIQCAYRQIFQCTCGEGTRFDRVAGQCVHAFDADCSCPPEPTANTTSSATDEQLAEDKESSDTVIIAVVITVVALIAVLIIAIFLYIRRKKLNEKERLKEEFGDPTYTSVSESYASIDDVKLADGIAPPLPDRDGTMATEIIYDNKVTMEATESSEPANVYEERTTVAEGETKRETFVVGVENDMYSTLKES